jgi:hypothetical protein
MPTAFAILSAVQYVASSGESPRVSSTVRLRTLADNGGMREGRVSSRKAEVRAAGFGSPRFASVRSAPMRFAPRWCRRRGIHPAHRHSTGGGRPVSSGMTSADPDIRTVWAGDADFS